MYKRPLVMISLICFLTGCAMQPKIEAIRGSVESNRFTHINTETEFSVSVPALHSGPYMEVDQFNFVINNEKSDPIPVSAIMVKERETKEWKVLKLLIKDSEQWRVVKEN